ncbi:hypothetical protein EYC80_009680 [Monilinia laxa]|uniref:Uncharacterized protein n=1 Tax=Monilinia laxa TaxID=61186 RepID=A0A5N6JYK9_MONLA|nr:hypothetical protein EYC80_009680 [Monilinia laxa]
MIPLEPAYQSHSMDVLNRNLAHFGADYLSEWRFEIGREHPWNSMAIRSKHSPLPCLMLSVKFRRGTCLPFRLNSASFPTPFKTIKEQTNTFDIIHQHIETSTLHLYSIIKFSINKVFKRANFFSTASSSNLDHRKYLCQYNNTFRRVFSQSLIPHRTHHSASKSTVS